MISWRAIVLVWILALAAAGGTLTLYRLAPPARIDRSVGAETLFTAAALPIEDVDHIEISKPNGEAFVFDREGTDWTQTKPFAWPVQSYSMRQIVVAAAGLEVSRRTAASSLGSDVTLKSLGLDPPLARLTLRWSNGAAELAIGRPSVAGRGYVLMGDDVLLVGRALQDRLLETDPKEWRSRDLIRGVSVEAKRLVVESGGTTIVLVRERKTWRMLEPVATRVDGVALDMLIRAVAGVQAAGFVVDEPSDLGRYGLAAPIGSVSVVLADDRKETLRIGSVTAIGATDRFAMVEGRPTVVKVTQASFSALFPQPTSLIDATATPVRPADIKTIEIEGPGGRVALSRDLERWVASSHESKQVESALVEEFLNQLTTARASEIAIQSFPDDLRLATVTLVGFDGKPMDVVGIARDERGRKFGFEDGDGVLRIFPDSISLRLSPADFGVGGG